MQKTTLVAIVIAVIAVLIVGVQYFAVAAPLRTDVAAMQKEMAALRDSSEVVAKRIGAAPVSPAKPVTVKNVAKKSTDLPPPLNRTAPTTVKVTLTIKEVIAEIADGTTMAFWTFDGTVPGPMIRVMEGDTVELTLVNPKENKSGHNIDLHAVNGPGGGAQVTNAAPGESKTFTFKALNSGLYIYHCAFAPPYVHVSHGLYGIIAVEPPGGLPKVDREFYVVQSDWYTTGKAGDTGHQEFSNEKALAENPEYYTFNGHTAALASLYPLEAKVGETVRIFFGVGGPNRGANFHIIGEIFDKVYTGAPDTYVKNEETWYVPPGSAAAFEFKLNVPATYLLVDHAIWRVAKGAAGVLNVTGPDNADIFSPPKPPGK